jgi:beta-N-acetylhexosaminidase
MESLSPDERIAQLMMVAAYSNRGEEHRSEILQLIKEHKIGGLIFFQGGPVRQAELMNSYQEASKVPLLGAIDAEWGLGMRLDSTISYPYQMALGAIQDDSMIYAMGKQIASQIKRVGLHLNFAPVVDVNNNANNPVINYRSFGENKFNVAKKGIAYMQGLQEEGVLPTAKHFPGHGDTDTDSHYALPQINHPLKRLDSLEFYPFKEIIKAGIGGVMVAHLNIPALDSSEVPSTLSKPIITGLLKNEFGFEGLIVTDAMNMKGVTKGNLPGEVDRDAVLAGNDLLEFTEDIPKAIEEIRKAVNEGLITQEEIDKRCRKILALKQWAGLDNYTPILTDNLIEDLNTPGSNLLNRKLLESSLTVLNNRNNLLPLKKPRKLKLASISIGAEKNTKFQESLEIYSSVKHFQLDIDAEKEEVNELKKKIKNYDFVIIGVHDEGSRPRNTMKFSEETQELLGELAKKGNTIISFFKNPYVINKLKDIEAARALILTYQDNELAEEVAAKFIMGGFNASGKLPVSIGDKYKEGDGITVKCRNVTKLSSLQDF